MPIITTVSSLSDQAFGGFNSGFPPSNNILPLISGNVAVRNTVNCSIGTWVGSPPDITYAYQWQIDSQNIGLATNSTYLIPSIYSNKTLTCQIQATNRRGTSFATSFGFVVAPAVPYLTGVTATVNNYNKITVTANAGNDGGATTTWYLKCAALPSLDRTQVGISTFVINLAPAYMTTFLTFTLEGINSVGSSGIYSSTPVKTEPALGTNISYIVGQTSIGRYVGDIKVVNFQFTYNSPWATTNTEVQSDLHPHVSVWRLPTVAEIQQYRVPSGIWNVSQSWTSESSGTGRHYTVTASGSAVSSLDTTSYFGMGIADILE